METIHDTDAARNRYGQEGGDDNVEFDEDRDDSSDDKEVDVDEI